MCIFMPCYSYFDKEEDKKLSYRQFSSLDTEDLLIKDKKDIGKINNNKGNY